MGSYSSSNILCPFYLSDNPRQCTMTCEGVLPGSSIKHHFANGAALRRQMDKYCADSYKSCPWATMMSNFKYQD